jgi:hypothetical protein
LRYSRAFFDLQITFAEHVAALSGRPLGRALLEHTNLYMRFGLGRGFDAAQGVWQCYLAGLVETGDVRDWTHRFYLTHAAADVGPEEVAAFGCFGYERRGEAIRLHFHNAEADGRAPLGVKCRDARRSELAALFGQVRQTLPESTPVVGSSWLYNLDAYRCLFPPAYLATARVLAGPFQHMPLWGQFLDRHGQIRPDAVHTFLQRLERQSSLEGLDDCFPFRVLRVEAEAREFHDFYGR